MKPYLSAEKKAEVMNLLNSIQAGDKIVFKSNAVIVYNESGCEINDISL